MYRLVSTGNGQLSTRKWVILLWAMPVGLRPNRAVPGINKLLGNLNSGRSSPWAKLIRSASLQLVFVAAISKLLQRLVSRCFYMSICVLFYDKVEVTRTIWMHSLEISCDKISWLWQVKKYRLVSTGMHSLKISCDKITWQLSTSWQLKSRLVRTGNGQLSTCTRVILLWATPVSLRPTRLRLV